MYSPGGYAQVLIKEEEVVSEDMRSKPAPAVQPGDRAFQKHISKPLPTYMSSTLPILL